MPTQVQVRGATQATQEARTLSAREIDINTTDGRLCVHDGATPGGMRHVNARDAQNQEFTYAAASGTDTITATYAYTPSAYANGQKFGFKAANNNTGAATFNVNSVGAVTIKKVSAGALADLDADDIVQNAYYEVEYNGTYFVVVGGIGGGGGTRPKTTATLSGMSTAITDIFEPGNNYRIEINPFIIQAGSNTGNFRVRLSDDGGSTYESSGYLMKGMSSTGSAVAAGTSTVSLSGMEGGLTTGALNRMTIHLFDPGAATITHAEMTAHVDSSGSANWGSSSGILHVTASGYLNLSAAIDSIQFSTERSGGVTGNVQIYEYPTS